MKKQNDLKNLINYYKKYKLLVITVIILSLGYALISLFSPIFEGKMLSYFENFNIKNIITFALLLMGLRIIIEIVKNLWSIFKTEI